MNNDNYPLLPSKYAREIDTKVSISYDHSLQRGVYQTMTVDKFATRHGVSSYAEIERLIRDSNHPVREEFRLNLERENKVSTLEKRIRDAEEKRSGDAFNMLISGIFIAGVINAFVILLSSILLRS